MIPHAACGLAALLLLSCAAQRSAGGAVPAAGQQLHPAGSLGSFAGKPANFTGVVQVAPVFPEAGDRDYSAAYVTFQPGARTAWHQHPTGQHIIVTAGAGRVGGFGDGVRAVRTGDAVYCPPGVRHWHGAAPDQAMTHLVITGSGQGIVAWHEHVSEAEYHASAAAPRLDGPPSCGEQPRP